MGRTSGAGFSGRPILQRALVAIAIAAPVGLLAAYALILAGGSIPSQRTDFITYYAAALMSLHGHGANIYSASALAKVERVVVTPFTLTYGVLPYVYPPYLAVALEPLAGLRLEAAYGAWAALNAAALAGVVIALRRVTGLSRWAGRYFCLACMTFLPAAVALLQGQTSVLLLGLLTVSYLALRHDRNVLAGSVLALALVKPPYVVPLLVLLLAQRRWRALGGFGATAGALFALPGLVLGWHACLDYLQTLRAASSWGDQFGYSPALNNSIFGPLHALLPGSAGTAAALVLAALILLEVVRAARRPQSQEIAFGLAVVVGLLISPHVLVHDLTLLLLPAGIALKHRGAYSAGPVAVLAVCYVTILVGSSLASFLQFEPACLGVLSLGWWFWAAARESRSGQRATEIVSWGVARVS